LFAANDAKKTSLCQEKASFFYEKSILRIFLTFPPLLFIVEKIFGKEPLFMKKAKILVSLKQDVLDPQGKAVEKALRQMDYDNVKSVRISKWIEIEFHDTSSETALKNEINEICDKLLANPNIETYQFEIVES